MATREQKMSRRQEKQAAKDVGGRVQANSGACRHGGGGDVRVPGKTRIECKATTKDEYILTLKTLDKLVEHARKGGLEMPVFQVRYIFGLPYHDYAGLRLRDYEALGGKLLPRRENAIIGKQYKLNYFELQEMEAERKPLFITFVDVIPVQVWVFVPWSTYLALLEAPTC